jgi:hypothetical protein
LVIDMTCPDDIADTVLLILRDGVLRARAACWSGSATHGAREADHVHNLPDLLADFSLERLRYYLEAEVPGFTAQCRRAGISVETFAEPWQTLRGFLEAQTETVPAKEGPHGD